MDILDLNWDLGGLAQKPCAPVPALQILHTSFYVSDRCPSQSNPA